MTRILKSKPIVEGRVEHLKEECEKLRGLGIIPTLKIILVGNNPASVIYTRNKVRFADRIGASAEIINLPEDISQEDFLKNIQELNDNKNVHGILVQLPLPGQLCSICTNEIIDPLKDVDGFHHRNFFHLFEGKRGEAELIPCTPKGVVTMLNYYGVELEGKNVVVIGRSLIVGRPLSVLLTNHDATVTLCHLGTECIEEHTRRADIIVTAAGDAKFFGEKYFNPEKRQVVIDVGINQDENGKLCGDVDFDKVSPLVEAISPVPGGVGPMTIMSLAENLILAAKLNRRT